MLHDPATTEDPERELSEGSLNLVVCVQGQEYGLPDFSITQLQISIDIANRYKKILCSSMHRRGGERELSVHLSELIVSFSRSATEAAALTDADDYEIPESVLDQDIQKLKELVSFQALIEYHNNKQKESGLSVEKIRDYLSADPNYDKIRDLVDNGVVIDTARDFKPIRRTAKFRNLQLRMLTVHRKAVVEMHGKSKVLLFRIPDISLEIYDTMHTANEHHWRPELGKIAGRPLLDCSNFAIRKIP